MILKVENAGKFFGVAIFAVNCLNFHHKTDVKLK